MEKYILQLIPKNNRVIVPNFGAFIVSRDAGITILFNNFLSFNDNLLINLVSTQEGISQGEATTKVSDYVTRIKQQLETEGEYSIPALGKFTHENNGSLRFEQDPHITDLFSGSTPESEKADPGLLDIDNISPEQGFISDEHEEELSSTIEDTGDQSLLNLDTGDTIQKTSINTPTPEPTTRDQNPTPPPEVKTKNPKVQEKPVRKGTLLPPGVIALLILIPIVIVALYFLFWHQPSGRQNSERQASITDSVKQKVHTDSAALTSVVPETTQKPDSLKPKTRVSNASPSHIKETVSAIKIDQPYHIIVGSFKKEANAQKKVTTLHAKGFADAIKFENKGMYVVSVLAFKSLNKAQASQEKLMNQHKMESWVLFRK